MGKAWLHMQRRHLAAVGAAFTALALLASPAIADATSAPAPHGTTTESVQKLHAEALSNTLSKTHGTLKYCAAYKMACDLQVLTTSPGSKSILTTNLPSGIGAGDLQSAYKLKNAKSANGTITIIDAAAFPPKDLEATLAMYRSTYGLPPCTLASGCLTVENRFGGRAAEGEDRLPEGGG